MIIHQAAFGPLKGHAFLEGSSTLLEETFRNAAWLTDLPQTAPAGVVWSPFFRLVRHDKYLLLIHTRPYSAATRAGMVLSRVAFIPVELVEQINDLRPIARRLQAEWCEGDATAHIDFSSPPFSTKVDEPSVLTMQIASALSQNVKRPLVVIGQEDFDTAMFDLWTRVPPEFRISLLFGLSFGHDDVRDLSIVCTPKELWARWDQRLQVDRAEEVSNCSYSATLLKLPTTDASRAFSRDLQLALDSPTAIKIALRAYELWTNSSGPSDDVALLRILAEKSGSLTSAMIIKSAIIEKLASSYQNWSGKDVLSMRNIEFAAFPGAKGLAECLELWASALPARATTSDVREIFQAWSTAKPTPLWLGAITAGLKSMLTNQSASDLTFIELWHSIVISPENGQRLAEILPNIASPPKGFVDCIPKSLNERLADDLLPEFVLRGWWDCIGVLLARSRSVTAAVNTAINLNAKNCKKTLLTNSLSEGSDHEIVSAAITTRDVIALEIAAIACIRTPSVLMQFDWKDPAWFQLLGEAISKSDDIIEWLPNPEIGMATIIDARLNNEEIWSVLVKTPLANLSNVRGRERAWEIIHSNYLTDIAETTAKFWLSRYEAGTLPPVDVEPYLLNAIRTQVNAENYLLEVLQRDPAALLRYLRDFGFASERDAQHFLRAVRQTNTTLTDVAARAIGEACRENRWTRAALDAAQSLQARSDFRPIVSECISILGYVDRMWFGFQLGFPVSLSADEAWAAFESEAVSLYPRGPSERELWSRSGGQVEDLDEKGNGRAIWHRVVSELRSGRAPGVHALLNVMLEDFQFNDTLKQLARQSFRR